jgi:4-amino-4-deoxy-L-arabinose transferase-like glycosyltransferase
MKRQIFAISLGRRLFRLSLETSTVLPRPRVLDKPLVPARLEVSRPVSRPASRSQASELQLAHVLALALVLLLATALRLINVNALGYNSDEAVYAGQAAALAQVPVLKDIFPVFRAHPLLFQFVLALVFAFNSADIVARLVSVAIGIATVLLTYFLGSRLYGRGAGLCAAFILAIMPYHVLVTRQVLLDGPMVLCATLSLFMLTRFAETQRPLWLYATGAGIGLTFLAKEIGLIMLGAVYAFLALSPGIRVRIRDIVIATFTMVAVMAPFPLAVLLAGGGSGGKTQQYLIWQLFRRPNHSWDFYPAVVPAALGYGVIALVILGFWILRREASWRERLLILWILVPLVFFQLWPTKGFQYLLPMAPPMALLAGRMLMRWPELSKPWLEPWLRFALLVVLGFSLLLPSFQRIQPSQSESFLAGSGGVVGGREMGEWIRDQVPEGATFLTIGPSLANIVKYYGHRQALGLSVSPNPLKRNPSYSPLENPDYQMRIGEVQYLVWDSFSAGRSSFFSEKLLFYAQKYNGRVVHTQTVSVTSPAGQRLEKPVIIIYEVHP